MSPVIAGIGGLMIGLALGWFVGHGSRGGQRNSAEAASRQQALEDEQRRLAREISLRDRTLSDMSDAQNNAEAAAAENRKLLRRLRDVEAALKSATSREDRPSAELEMQLVIAVRERDAAQKALMAAEAHQAIERSRPPPGEFEPEPFDELPDLEDTDETEERPENADTTLIPDESDGDHTLFPEDAQPATATSGDDLTVLSGIGAATQEKLVELGIATFSDLAEMSDEAVADLERQLGSRRPSRDDWRGQASALLSSRQEDR